MFSDSFFTILANVALLLLGIYFVMCGWKLRHTVVETPEFSKKPLQRKGIQSKGTALLISGVFFLFIWSYQLIGALL